MTEKREARLPVWGIVLYLVLFFAAWTLRELFLRARVVEALGLWGAAFTGAAVKLLLWTLPAYLLVRAFPADMAMPHWFAGKVRWPRLLLWVVCILGYHAIGALIRTGGLSLQPGFSPSQLIGTVLFVGITEEAVFRGFLLNTLLTRMGERWALGIDAALFVLIHFPIWYTGGTFAVPLEALGSCVSIFVLSLLFSLSYLKDRNLITPILLHMAWNTGALLLFGR